MRLLAQLNEEVEVLIEGSGNEKKYYIEGKFLSSEPNKNNRIYPKHVLNKACQSYQENYISQNRALGELNHPNTGPMINLDKVCHIVESLNFHGNDVYGKARVLGTPMGNILKTLLDEKVKIGVSSRGMGSIKQGRNGLKEIQEDFKLSAVDVVNDPSGKDCYVNGIMESAEWVEENGIWKIVDIDEVKNTIRRTPSKQLNETKLKLFEEFLRKLN
jgi:hypothetical protein